VSGKKTKLKLKQNKALFKTHPQILLLGFPPTLFSSSTFCFPFSQDYPFSPFQDSMENPQSVSRGLKRKLEGDESQDQPDSKLSLKIRKKILHQVSLLDSDVSDCDTIKRAIHNIALIAENGTPCFTLLTVLVCVCVVTEFHFFLFHCCFFLPEDNVDIVLDCGVVPALMKHFQLPDAQNDDNGELGKDCSEGITQDDDFEVAKGCALIFDLLAVKVIKFHHSFLFCNSVLKQEMKIWLVGFCAFIQVGIFKVYYIKGLEFRRWDICLLIFFVIC